jgi:hypothetical protein
VRLCGRELPRPYRSHTDRYQRMPHPLGIVKYQKRVLFVSDLPVGISSHLNTMAGQLNWWEALADRTTGSPPFSAECLALGRILRRSCYRTEPEIPKSALVYINESASFASNGNYQI